MSQINLLKLYNTLGSSLDYVLADAQESVNIFSAPLYKKEPFYNFKGTSLDENIVSVPVIVDSMFVPTKIFYEGQDYTIENGTLNTTNQELLDLEIKYCPVVYYNDNFFYNKWGAKFFKKLYTNNEEIQNLSRIIAKYFVLGPYINVFKDIFGIEIELKDRYTDPNWINGLTIPASIAGQDIVVDLNDPNIKQLYETYFKHNLFGIFIKTSINNTEFIEAIKEKLLEGRPIWAFPIFKIEVING